MLSNGVRVDGVATSNERLAFELYKRGRVVNRLALFADGPGCLDDYSGGEYPKGKSVWW